MSKNEKNCKQTAANKFPKSLHWYHEKCAELVTLKEIVFGKCGILKKKQCYQFMFYHYFEILSFHRKAQCRNFRIFLSFRSYKLIFAEFRSSKTAILDTFGALNLANLAHFSLPKVKMKTNSIYCKNGGICTLLWNFCQNSVRVNFHEKRNIWMTEYSWYLTRYSDVWIRFSYVSYWFCHFDLSWAFHILRNYRLGSDLLQSLEEKNIFQIDAQYMYHSVEINRFLREINVNLEVLKLPFLQF